MSRPFPLTTYRVLPKLLTDSKGKGTMNREIKDIADWAQSQGWTVVNDRKGYTRFYDPDGNYVTNYPAKPSNPRRRLADLTSALKRAGLALPAPSKKERRSRRTQGREEE